MKLCEGGRGTKSHEQIIYDEANCPMCMMMEDHAGNVADLNENIDALKEVIYSLKEDAKVEVGV